MVGIKTDQDIRPARWSSPPRCGARGVLVGGRLCRRLLYDASRRAQTASRSDVSIPRLEDYLRRISALMSPALLLAVRAIWSLPFLAVSGSLIGSTISASRSSPT